MEFSREEVRKLIFYCWKRGLNASKVSLEIKLILGDGVTSKRTCRDWIKKFEIGDFSTSDQMRSGRPSRGDLNDKIIDELADNKHASSRELADTIRVSHVSIWRHLVAMGKQYLHNRWVPHKLSDENKTFRINICTDLIKMNQEASFLNSTITCDECWVYWENECYRRKRSWQGAGDMPVAVPQRTSMTKRKHLATVFWDSKGLLLLDAMPPNQSMNAQYYCDLLDKLKIEVQRKRRRLNDTGYHRIHFLHDNARPHVAAITRSKLEKLSLTVLPHPPYSPDIAPSDFYLFSPMKTALKGKNFASEIEIQTVLQHWFDSKPPAFFQRAFSLLPDRWQKIIDNEGVYFS